MESEKFSLAFVPAMRLNINILVALSALLGGFAARLPEEAFLEDLRDYCQGYGRMCNEIARVVLENKESFQGSKQLVNNREGGLIKSKLDTNLLGSYSGYIRNRELRRRYNRRNGYGFWINKMG